MRESDEKLVTRYIGGLHLSFQDTLNMFSPLTISEAHQRAMLLERQQTRRPPTSSTGRPLPVEQRSSGNQSSTSRQMGTAPSPSNSTRNSNTRPSACFSCGEIGHRQSVCPKLVSGHALLSDEVTTPFYIDYPIYDEHVDCRLPRKFSAAMRDKHFHSDILVWHHIMRTP